MSAQARIEAIKQEGYDIDFGDIFNQSLEIYKKIALNAGLAFLLLVLVLGAIMVGISVVSMGLSSFARDMAGFNPTNFGSVGMVIYVAGIVVISGLIAPMNAGILKMAYLASQNQQVTVGNAFDYYKTNYFKELFIVAALIGFLNGIVNLITVHLDLDFVGQLFNYTVAFLMILTTPLIVFGELKALDSIKVSLQLVLKQFFVLLGLVIIAIIISGLGIIGFCLGIFFTFPFIYSTIFCIYENIIGTGKHSELDEIGATID